MDRFVSYGLPGSKSLPAAPFVSYAAPTSTVPTGKRTSDPELPIPRNKHLKTNIEVKVSSMPDVSCIEEQGQDEEDETMPWSIIEVEDGVLSLWEGTPVRAKPTCTDPRACTSSSRKPLTT